MFISRYLVLQFFFKFFSPEKLIKETVASDFYMQTFLSWVLTNVRQNRNSWWFHIFKRLPLFCTGLFHFEVINARASPIFIVYSRFPANFFPTLSSTRTNPKAPAAGSFISLLLFSPMPNHSRINAQKFTVIMWFVFNLPKEPSPARPMSVHTVQYRGVIITL